MFSKAPNFLKEAQKSDTSDLVVPGVTIPDPSHADLVWQKTVDKLLTKCNEKNLNKLNKIFETANKEKEHWRLWYILNIRHKLACPTALFSDKTKLVGYSDASDWTLLKEALFHGDETSALLMASVFNPTTEVRALNDNPKAILNGSKLPVKLLMGWHEAGRGYLPQATLTAIAESGTLKDCKKLIEVEGLEILSQVDLNRVLKAAARSNAVDVISYILDVSDMKGINLYDLYKYSESVDKVDVCAFFKEKYSLELKNALSEIESEDQAPRDSETALLADAKWQKISDTYIVQNISDAPIAISAHFDFSARRMTQMQKGANDEVLILFSENFTDIEGQSVIAKAAEVLKEQGGTPDFESGCSVKSVLKTVKKPK